MSVTSYPLNNGVVVTQDQLDHWNRKLASLQPHEIIQWAITTFPNLFQTTAFGLTGLATINMISKILKDESNEMIPLIFIDTLHHFPQTLVLLKKIEDRYYKPKNQSINVYHPKDIESETEFATKYGDFLWETDENKYDFLVKVEPAHRAYTELNVGAVFTGRRKSQGGSRSALKFVELDELNKIIKINPLANWDFKQVQDYVNAESIPYNELLDLGYRSIGDYHSTQPVGEGEDERAGRWKGKAKTECGIHETSRFAQFLTSDGSRDI